MNGFETTPRGQSRKTESSLCWKEAAGRIFHSHRQLHISKKIPVRLHFTKEGRLCSVATSMSLFVAGPVIDFEGEPFLSFACSLFEIGHQSLIAEIERMGMLPIVACNVV